jgi:hypothetical protein
VTVLLETPGPNGIPNDDDDIVVNKYVTDHWVQPSASADPQDNGQGGPNSFTQNCNPIRDFAGNDITSLFSPTLGRTPGIAAGRRGKTRMAFDGGYAFADCRWLMAVTEHALGKPIRLPSLLLHCSHDHADRMTRVTWLTR